MAPLLHAKESLPIKRRAPVLQRQYHWFNSANNASMVSKCIPRKVMEMVGASILEDFYRSIITLTQ